MQLNLVTARGKNQEPILAVRIGLPAATLDAVAVMRELKKNFPDEYAAVSRELILPDRFDVGAGGANGSHQHGE
jgi:hypothetical protein